MSKIIYKVSGKTNFGKLKQQMEEHSLFESEIWVSKEEFKFLPDGCFGIGVEVKVI